MKVHKITLLNTEDGTESSVEVPENEYILDIAEEVGIELPYSCRAGACCTCVGKMVSGEVDQAEQSFLDDVQLREGYVILCVAYPLSDCAIETHVESQIF